ncbi:MAG: hypothetical protein IJO42_04480 [Clostridia bacterium]|nr:hypothetical protein [Clostridia bacterium]
MRKMNKHLRIGLIALIIFIVFIAAFLVLSSMIQNGLVNDILIPQKLEGSLVFVIFLPLLTALFFFGKFCESKKRFPIAKILKFMAIALLVFSVLQMAFTFIGCYNPVQNGTYVAVGDYKSFSIGDYTVSDAPYIRLNTDKNLFGLALLSSSGFEEQGPYGFDQFGELVATSQSDVAYRFEVKDENTLIFKSPADNIYNIPIGTIFVFSKDFK